MFYKNFVHEIIVKSEITLHLAFTCQHFFSSIQPNDGY